MIYRCIYINTIVQYANQIIILIQQVEKEKRKIHTFELCKIRVYVNRFKMSNTIHKCINY